MANPRDALTPHTLALLQRIATEGSFAAAARAENMVPSALTYRVRQVEDALDVLLFDRSSRQARLTEAGRELLREGARLLGEIDAVANRVKRVATGWEPRLTIASDGVIVRDTVMELAESFLALEPPTRLKLRDEVLSGTLDALVSGQADLALGISAEPAAHAGLQVRPLGEIRFVFVLAPHHPLAALPEPLSPAQIRMHRVVAVADTTQRGAGTTVGLLEGQDVLTVPTLQAKLEAQLRGLGVGALPEPMVRPYIDSGMLLERRIAQPDRILRIAYAWRASAAESGGRALQWWLQRLESQATRDALLRRAALAGRGLT